jgi:hypothetical protein
MGKKQGKKAPPGVLALGGAVLQFEHDATESMVDGVADQSYIEVADEGESSSDGVFVEMAGGMSRQPDSLMVGMRDSMFSPAAGGRNPSLDAARKVSGQQLEVVRRRAPQEGGGAAPAERRQRRVSGPVGKLFPVGHSSCSFPLACYIL